jgi:hypothetical protein
VAVPSFLSTVFGHHQINVTVDVQDILDALVTKLTGLSTPWTHSAGVFTSPTDAVGRFVKMTLSRTSATRLNIIAVDHLARNIFNEASKHMDIVAAGDRVQMFYGPQYCWVEALSPGTANLAEHFGIGILDLTPEAQNAHNHWMWARAKRTAAGASDANGNTWSNFHTISVSTGVASPGRLPVDLRNYAATQLTALTLNGRAIYTPVDLTNLYSGETRIAGRLYQAMKVPTIYEAWTDIEIPIDDSPQTLGTFRVSNCGRDGASPQIAFRIA